MSYQHIKVVAGNNKTVYNRTAICFGSLSDMKERSIKTLYYTMAVWPKDVENVKLVRRHLLPALGLDPSRVVIRRKNSVFPTYFSEVVVKNKQGDGMWAVYIMSSIFRNFIDNHGSISTVAHLIKKGMDPVVAYAVGGSLTIHPRSGRAMNWEAGAHYLFWKNPKTNYVALRRWIDGKVKDNKLTTTGRKSTWPRPRPSIDTTLFEVGPHNGDVSGLINDGEYREVEKLVKGEHT